MRCYKPAANCCLSIVSHTHCLTIHKEYTTYSSILTYYTCAHVDSPIMYQVTDFHKSSLKYCNSIYTSYVYYYGNKFKAIDNENYTIILRNVLSLYIESFIRSLATIEFSCHRVQVASSLSDVLIPVPLHRLLN